MNDADFLAAIRAAPHDAAPRLVYADWLEERGDPRAELIRVEEEMRRLPVFADRYWELKPRRVELLSRASADWLEALGYSGWRPTFHHGFPDGWKERWRLIRAFTEVWLGIPMNDVGGRTAEIQEVETRLQRPLPSSVREWVAYVQDVGPVSWLHELRAGSSMTELEGHGAVSLLINPEWDYHWAVRHKHLSFPDPPVYGYTWDIENPNVAARESFVPVQRGPQVQRVTEFTLDYVMAYAAGAGGGFGADVEDSRRLIADLKAAFPIHARFGQTEVFERENVLVVLPPWNRHIVQQLKVEVFRPMPREALPAFLLEYADEYPPSEPHPWIADDEIPF